MAASRIPGPICSTRNASSTEGFGYGRRAFQPGPVGVNAQRLIPSSGMLPVALTGNFTLLKYIANLGAEDLERRLGFASGRLRFGFRLVILAPDETISEDDFDLIASTRWSGGEMAKAPPTGEGTDIEKLLVSRGQDVNVLKSKVVAFFAKRGGNTPAKILPNLVDKDGSMHYPAGEALEVDIQRGVQKETGVPQFTLKKNIRKKAQVIRSEP